MAARLDPHTAAPRSRADRVVVDAIVLSLGTLVLRVPALLASRHLLFDDGVYGASAVAMRHGALPFREVFSSQGPLFLPLVFVADLVGLRTLDAPRVLALASGVALTLAVYATGRELTGRSGALLAAALTTTSGAVLWTTGPLTSDGPGVALGAWAMVVALRYRRRPGPGAVVTLGVLAGAGFAVKSLLVLPPLAAVAIIVLASRRARDLLLLAVVAAAVVFVVSVPWGLGNVVEQSVRYHTDATGDHRPLDNIRKVASTLADRDPLLVAFGAAAVVSAAVRRWGRDPGRETDHERGAARGRSLLDRVASGRGPVVVWLVMGLVVLAVESPLWRNHLAHVVPPAALLVGVYRPPWKVLVVIGVLVVPYQAWHLHDLLWPAPYRGDAARVERALRALPEGAEVVADDPGLAWRAGRRTLPDFVDTSVLRIDATTPRLRITGADVASAARRREVCAVVVWSRDRFGSLTDLPARLADAGYAVEARYASGRTLYLKRDCRAEAPGGPTDRTAATAGRDR